MPGIVLLALPLVYSIDETTAVFACEVAAAGYTLAVLLGLLPSGDAGHSPTGQEDPLVRWFWRLAVLWTVSVGLSVVTSENVAASYPVFLKLLALLLLVLAAGWSGRSPAWFRGMILSAGVAGWLHGVLGIVEYLEGAPMPATWADPALRGLIRTRCAGLFTDPNVFGAFLAALLPWQLAGIATPPRERSEAAQAFFAGSLLVTGTALLMTFSRGAYLAGIAGLILSTILWKISPRGTWSFGGRLVTLVGAVLLVLFAVGPFKYRFISIANTKDMTFSQRTLINRGIYAAAAGVPLTGYGLHTFSQVYPRFRCVGGDYPMNAHNEFYQIFIEAGPGAAFLLGLVSLCLGWAVLRLRYRPNSQEAGSGSLAPGWRSFAGLANGAGGAAAGSFAVFFLHNLSGFSARMLPTAA
ncbi:MAG TPA: O-antigen ligase family protein, partial [Candidatus Ozemobacteraceae bacterium]